VYPEGSLLIAATSTLSGYPMEETIRGRLGTIKFVKGGFQVFADDPARGASFPPRQERALEPTEFVPVESPKNETETLWVNFLECIRSRRHATFCPPDLACSAVQTISQAEARLAVNRKPNRPILGWTGGDRGSVLNPPHFQKLAGPWVNGRDPA
jgi:hypothetical protein